MSCGKEVHVNDVGTLYKVRVLDDDLPFDPSTSNVQQLIFALPEGVVLTKTATIVPDGSPATSWFLKYTVQPADGAGSPPAEFHATPGRVSVQGYLAWADGSHFHSDIQTTDEEGNELRIYPNLA